MHNKSLNIKSAIGILKTNSRFYITASMSVIPEYEDIENAKFLYDNFLKDEQKRECEKS